MPNQEVTSTDALSTIHDRGPSRRCFLTAQRNTWGPTVLWLVPACERDFYR